VFETFQVESCWYLATNSLQSVVMENIILKWIIPDWFWEDKLTQISRVFLFLCASCKHGHG